jgi:hypothetical protein
MLSETAAEIQFPATCARCGVRVAERVLFCPHCGTHARLAFAKSERKSPQAAPAPAKDRKEPTAARETGVPPWTARPQPLFAAAGDASPFAGIAAPVRDFHADNGRQWGVKTGTAVTLAAFVALFGSIVLLHRHDNASSQEQQAPLRTAEGSVQRGAPTPPPVASSGNAHDSGSAHVAPRLPATPVTPTTPPAALAAAPLPPKRAPTALAPAPSAAAPNTRPGAARTTIDAAPAVTANTNVPDSSAQANAARARGQTKEPTGATRAPETNRYASLAPKKTARRSASAYTDAAIPPQPAVPLLPDAAPPDAAPRPAMGNSPYSPNEAPSIRDANAQREPHQAALEHSIALAQASLAKGNLAAARRALDAARAAQPGNSEAFMLQQDLVSRERARDSALNSARVCAVQQEWNCTWHQAGSALSIDAGSVEAKALVQRAMIESGAAFRPAGPGADGPDVPLLAQ